MPLADDIRLLRTRTLAALAAAHDYYADTKTAWEIVGRTVAAGEAVSVPNPVTGTVRTGADLADRSAGYVDGPLTEATFQQFLSIFETFVFDLLRLWLLAYPRSLAGKKLDFKAVLDAPDKEAVALDVVNRELNDVMYERPAGWFLYLDKLVKLGRPTPDEVERLTEAKASRDVIVHSQGVVGQTYLLKAGRSGALRGGAPDRPAGAVPPGDLRVAAGSRRGRLGRGGGEGVTQGSAGCSTSRLGSWKGEPGA